MRTLIKIRKYSGNPFFAIDILEKYSIELFRWNEAVIPFFRTYSFNRGYESRLGLSFGVFDLDFVIAK